MLDRHSAALSYGVAPIPAKIPASMVRRDAFFTDPWWSHVDVVKRDTEHPAAGGTGRGRATGRDAVTEEVLVTEERFSLTLLDGRTATHTRRVVRDPRGRRRKQFLLQTEDGANATIAQLAPVLPLYGLERFDPTDDPEIIVVEGVAAAQALHGLGFPAAGTLTGALHTPSRNALVPVARFERIYLWPDNDSIGVQHMARIAHRLETLGAKDLRVIRWAGPRKGDAADFQEGATGVRALMQQARPWLRGTQLGARGQLAVNTPRMPSVLALPVGVRHPLSPADQTPRTVVFRPPLRQTRREAGSHEDADGSHEDADAGGDGAV